MILRSKHGLLLKSVLSDGQETKRRKQIMFYGFGKTPDVGALYRLPCFALCLKKIGLNG